MAIVTTGKKDWTSEYVTLIEGCENRDHLLTDWDRTFLDSIKSTISKGYAPSAKQVEKLEEIWEKATAKG